RVLHNAVHVHPRATDVDEIGPHKDLGRRLLDLPQPCFAGTKAATQLSTLAQLSIAVTCMPYC
ncbi:MAG: hypothetical protein ACK5A3_13205, partial [Planctomyces sp.]